MFERLVWIVPLAVAALGAWRPRAGLIALTASLPLFGVSPGGPYLAALDVAALAAILTAWRGGRAEPSPLAPAAAAFVAVSLMSLVPLAYAPPSWRPSVLLELVRALPEAPTWSALFSWRAALDLLLGWGLFLAVRRSFAGRSPLPLAQAALAGLTASLLLGFAATAELIDLDGYRPRQFRTEPRDQRLRSLFFASTRYAEYLVIAAPFALAAVIGEKGWARRLFWPLAGLAVAGVALTLQRGAWLALAAQGAFLALGAVLLPRGRATRWRQAAVPLVITTALVGGLLLATGASREPLADRFTDVGRGWANRLPLWAAAVDMTRDRPLLGQGLGSWAPAWDRLEEADLVEPISFRMSGHHLYLQIAAERGLLGLLALGLLAMAAVLCLRRPPPASRPLALGLATSLVGIAVYGLVQYVFQLRNLALLIWTLLACVALVAPPQPSRNVRRAAWALAAAALLVVSFRLASGAFPLYAGRHEFGFHEIEGEGEAAFRWTSRFAATRLRREGDTLILTLANGHPRGGDRPVRVTAAVDGRQAGVFTVAGGWEEHRLDVRNHKQLGSWVVLTLSVAPTFRPFSDYHAHPGLGPSRDHRQLGVAVKDFYWSLDQ